MAGFADYSVKAFGFAGLTSGVSFNIRASGLGGEPVINAGVQLDIPLLEGFDLVNDLILFGQISSTSQPSGGASSVAGSIRIGATVTSTGMPTNTWFCNFMVLSLPPELQTISGP